MEDEEEKHIEMEEQDVEEASSAPSDDSFINDDSDDPIIDDDDDNQQSLTEEPLTDKEIEELIAELLETESKAAEAQEALEEESVSKVEADVREELSQTLTGDELENAVADEMTTFKEEWEAVLDELETESAHLLEQLDGAGIELPSLYKWIESQAPHGCCTEAWKNRTQWVGSELTNDLTGAIADAEKYLQIHRPVRRKHGKVLEEGASGFLAKKLAGNDGSEALGGSSGVDWGSFSKLCSDNSSSSMGTTSFGSKDWASVYLASTPQQAAELGLKFPGVDEVEEIDDIEDSSGDPFVTDAIANERELNLSEEQKRKFKKVKEEDDLKTDLKLRRCLKQRRRKNRQKLEEIQEDTTDDTNGYLSQDFGFDTKKYSTVDDLDALKSNEGTSVIDATVSKCLHEIDAEAKGLKCLHNSEEMELQSKKSRIITPDSDEEDLPGEMLSPTFSLSETGDQSNPQRNGDNVLPVSSLPACNDKQNFRCTACDKVAVEVHAHPLLRVVLCLDCKTSMKTKMQDVDCSECYCRWCGRCSDLLSCKSCKRLFCSVCIRRNLGEEILLGIKTSGWQCCCCSPSILHPLVSVLEKIMESQGLVDSSTDSDSDNSDASDADINGHRSTKRRPKKKIRRILDDTELGEETKRKIAIEKERQERLKSLGAKFSSKTMFIDSGDCCKSSYGSGSLEMLGDVETGYIVNVVREEGEEAVRIPRSISAKLKSHQVAGIRFMWENIIQSIRKVKSGDKGLGCILAHTMGLGKTFQVISFLYAAMRSVDLGLKTALIVTPVSVLHNWRQEFIKWEPTEMKPLRVFMLEDVPRERRVELLQKWRLKGGVFLIGYTAFRNLTLGKHIKERHVAREICQALQDGPDILVCDEAHIIKNTRADVTQALKQVKCQRRIALTGSPLQNNLMEYYCMVDFVREGFLGSSHEFRNRFQNPIENGQHTNSTADDVKIMNQRSHILYEHLKGFVQRMDMNVVKMDLPPKTVYVMSVKLSPLQRKLYKRFLDVHGFTKDKVSGEKIMKRSFFAGYQALAQIWNHPGILQLMRENRTCSRPEDAVEILLADDCSSDENTDYNVVPGEKPNSNSEALKKNHNGFLHGDWWSDLLENNCKEVDYSGKMVLLLDILTMSSKVGDKALVFSQSLSTLDLLELYLSKLTRPGKKGKYWKRRKDWYRIDGRTESSERQRLVDCFNSPLNRRVKCALISTRAGSLGINLYAANRVIIVDGSWNPTHDLQAIYRAWRYGQTKPVFAYRLLAHGTMEEKIYKRQVTKEGLAARVVDRQQVHRTISKEEMLHLFEFGDDESCDIPLELKQVREHAGEASANVDVGSVPKQKLTLPNGNSSSDKLMQSLIDRHHPRWIANYHEHESLLQENEDEKLSKEEQEMAWEVYRRSIEWEERRVSPDEPVEQHVSTTESLSKQKPVVPSATVFPPEDSNLVFSVGGSRCRLVPRKCTNLSHLLTLRSQGTKWGCSTVCGECAQEISWEGLNRDGRSAK
ncbi:protein CHROMATIN REMODELING 20 isoform X2 [Solanum dulcamara]|uniref:protein CHROMATIN REMODELING 20 isoform X2 n=1 Tax=Solanum dulcamara TaxID=45834 RepID=UPI002484DD7C|nr:protein CHROMATIN REMODELING 20 isoform X2 [Solanum dulcamara]